MPVLLASLATVHGFTDGQLGNIASAYSVGATLIAVTSVFWMRANSLRRQSGWFAALGLAALTAVALWQNYASILATFLIAGIGFGGVYTLMIALLAQADDPNRAFGCQWGLGSLPGIALLYAIPLLGGMRAGRVGPLLSVLWVNAAATLAVTALPGRLVARRHEFGTPNSDGVAPADRRAAGIGLAAMFAYYLGITGGWSFLDKVGIGAGISPAFCGGALAVATAVSSLVALAAGRFAEVGARRGGMAAATGAMLFGLGMLAMRPDDLGFTIGTVIFIGLATFVLTYATGVIAPLNLSSRAGAMPAIALGAGSIAGPAMAGHVYQAGGAAAMLFVCGLSLLVGLLGYVMVYTATVGARTRAPVSVPGVDG